MHMCIFPLLIPSSNILQVSKNEYQRMRNIAKSKRIKVPSMGLPPSAKLNSLQVG